MCSELKDFLSQTEEELLATFKDEKQGEENLKRFLRSIKGGIVLVPECMTQEEAEEVIEIATEIMQRFE